MKFGIVLDRTFKRHATPAGHPERPDRIEAIVQDLENWDRFARLVPVAPVRAEQEWIVAVHAEEHFERVKAAANQSFHAFDPDTYAGPESYDVALQAAGSTVRLLDRLLQGSIGSGFAAVRPPGHHAESRKAMGFCLFNNVAVAAEWALRKGLVKKVAVVDFDVHHGNGTQEIFYSRADVLYVSTHQYPFYPGTGHHREVGRGDGEGFTVNFPIRAGMGNHFYCSLFREFIVPVLHQFAPEVILISAGYDAHRDDPLAGMNLDVDGFGTLVNLLNGAAREVCAGRILYILEGGYHLQALSEAVRWTISTSIEPREFKIEATQTEDYEVYRTELRRALSDYWKL